MKTIDVAAPLPHGACSNCNLREFCLPVAMGDDELTRLDGLVGPRRSLARGEALYRSGDRFDSLYAVRAGFFKSRLEVGDGREQVTGFQMAGELLGFDGIGSDRHTCDAIALETSQVCVIPFARLEALSREVPTLQRQVHKALGREIARDHEAMLLLGSMRSDERLAAFLLNLAQRMQARGYSASELVLRMTREEIGSYLGVNLETVSRTFSKFQADGILAVQSRQVRILDEAALRRVVATETC